MGDDGEGAAVLGPGTRLVTAFAGGALTVLRAALARGCTSRPGPHRRGAAQPGKSWAFTTTAFAGRTRGAVLRPGGNGDDGTFSQDGAFGDEASLVVAFLIGIGFGLFLKRAGFGSARKLVSQFYLNDLAVFKVMFTAIVTAMLGVHYWRGPAGLTFRSCIRCRPTSVPRWPAVWFSAPDSSWAVTARDVDCGDGDRPPRRPALRPAASSPDDGLRGKVLAAQGLLPERRGGRPDPAADVRAALRRRRVRGRSDGGVFHGASLLEKRFGAGSAE